MFYGKENVGFIGNGPIEWIRDLGIKEAFHDTSFGWIIVISIQKLYVQTVDYGTMLNHAWLANSKSESTDKFVNDMKNVLELDRTCHFQGPFHDPQPHSPIFL